MRVFIGIISNTGHFPRFSCPSPAIENLSLLSSKSLLLHVSALEIRALDQLIKLDLQTNRQAPKTAVPKRKYSYLLLICMQLAQALRGYVLYMRGD